MKNTALLLFFLLTTAITKAQGNQRIFPLKDTTRLQAISVTIQPQLYKSRQSVQVRDAATDVDTELRIAKLPGISFHNGTIEVELSGEPMKNSSQDARGFVGIAFRIDASNTRFECIYLRPTNGRAEDQLRRNHSVQYFSYPGFPWYKLREQFPAKYETYVDLEPGKWTKYKIEVKGNTAKLFVNGATQPTLIVSDLKQGEHLSGSIGLWVGPGTEAHFRNLVVRQLD